MVTLLAIPEAEAYAVLGDPNVRETWGAWFDNLTLSCGDEGVAPSMGRKPTSSPRAKGAGQTTMEWDSFKRNHPVKTFAKAAVFDNSKSPAETAISILQDLGIPATAFQDAIADDIDVSKPVRCRVAALLSACAAGGSPQSRLGAIRGYSSLPLSHLGEKVTRLLQV